MTASRPGLTDRQAAILALVAAGVTAPAVATQLGIKPETVRKQLAAARRRTGTTSTREALLIARERGWMSPR
ncbi:LuxR C-terminal-related transcriptional regulator [Phytohabitans rumicis]|uniref:HTH luxR-type domain-containing protein n=1 Tax=Phytohabitans rumicis TaxID=1076125 RepID=A0A6V8LA95_9ACTN|nr:LuxR C-terminal-related transcriptional regulator [Phytohabitans rumicis]GFJ91701.1 hypothetical protein Prum_053430 [Phytohabitans rumicis]